MSAPEKVEKARPCSECGGPLSETRIELDLETCSGPCNASWRKRGDVLKIVDDLRRLGVLENLLEPVIKSVAARVTPEWRDCGQTPCITCDPRRTSPESQALR